MTTETADYRFIVKEIPSTSGADWGLECYPESRQFSFVPDTSAMCIRLSSETSESEAKSIRDLLNQHVVEFILTR